MPVKTKKANSKSGNYDGLHNLKGNRLLKKLEEIDSALQKATTLTDFPGFYSLFGELRHSQLLHTDKKDIRVALGCCFMEIFRLDSGMELDDEESALMIRMIFSCVQFLNNDSISNKKDRLLKVFGDLKESRVLQVLVSVDVGYKLSIDLVNLLFNLPDGISEDVKDIRVSILLSLLDLYKHIPHEILDLLLVELLDQDPSRSECVREVLLSRKSRFASSIQQFCMNVLCNNDSDCCYESGDVVGDCNIVKS